jgi:hypothetical protein
VHHDGLPLEAWAVWLDVEPRRRGGRRVIVNGDGAFRFDFVEPGEHELHVSDVFGKPVQGSPCTVLVSDGAVTDVALSVPQ